MKRLLLSTTLMLCFSGAALAQHTVSGTVTDLSSNPVAGQKVIIMSNPRQGAGSFTPITAMTNTSGQYSGTLPTGLANNTGIDVETYDCSSTAITNNHTYTGSNIANSNFSICVTPPPTGISGMVYTSNTKRSVRAVVYRIRKCTGTPTTLTLIDSMLTDTLGGYSFSTFPTIGSGCDLLMKAALLPADADYANYLPSYYVSQSSSALLWSGAATITQSSAGGGINIQLTSGTNPGGPGFIGGSVLSGANKGTGVGDPVVNRLFLLTDAFGNAVAYTYSDAAGKFGFSNLAYGTYKLFGDAWGKNNPELTVVINSNEPSVNNVIFHESSKKLEGYYEPASVTIAPALSNISVYPNPVTDVINIKGLNTVEGNTEVVLVNMTGSVVYSGAFNNTANVSVPTANLAGGIYMLQVKTEAGTLLYKIAK